MRLFLGYILILINLCVSTYASPHTLSVAVASNLSKAVDEIDNVFESLNPDVKIKKIVGSTGQLVAQIEHEAPVDVLLSADYSFVDQLIQSKRADSNKVCPFTHGVLVVWSMDSDLALKDLKSSLLETKVLRIAIANPKNAPFGKAAHQVIKNLKLTDVLNPKIVTAESIAQAAQFVQSGNAQLGFIALSSIRALTLKEQGRWLVVSDELYEPLEQTAVVLNKTVFPKDAEKYVLFLKADLAQTILAKYGYKN